MKKTFLKVMGITLALSLMLLSVFTGCAPKEKEPEEETEEPEEETEETEEERAENVTYEDLFEEKKKKED